MRRLLVAIGFLTRLPVPRLALRPEDFAQAVRLYPLVGLLVGALIAGAAWAGGHIDPWVGALAALAAWIGLTGALHLDGLGDLADGLGAAHGDRQRLLAVMADPHVGSFAVVAIALQLIAKLVLVHAVLPGGWLALLLVPAAARLGPLAWARWLAPLKSSGLGASLQGAVRRQDIAGWLAILMGAAIVAPALLAAPLVIGALLLWFRRCLGGMTGDAHGAGIEMAETGLLLCFAATQAVAR